MPTTERIKTLLESVLLEAEPKVVDPKAKTTTIKAPTPTAEPVVNPVAKPTGKVAAKPAAKPPVDNGWWKKYTKYQLSRYPIGVPEKDVTVDTSGDVNSHAVMTWYDPKTHVKIYSYTKARMDAQAQQKWGRTSNISSEQVDKVKALASATLTSKKSDDQQKQAAAIISIIAQTGLRPGSREGTAATGNRGVSTLGPENIHIAGDNIKLTFTGKSYQENLAEIKDGILANYLKTRLGTKEEFIFNVPEHVVNSFYKKTLSMGDFKIKDLRTHMAGTLAKDILENDPLPPPPLPEKPSEIKKQVKAKLKHVFELVSERLNNTPAMAKGSYINPVIISNWLTNLGIAQQVVNSVGHEGQPIEEDNQEVDFVGDAPIYKLPAWWYDDNIQLVKRH